MGKLGLWRQLPAMRHPTQHGPQEIQTNESLVGLVVSNLRAMAVLFYVTCTAGICTNTVQSIWSAETGSLANQFSRLAGDKLIECTALTSYGWKGRNFGNSTKIQCLPRPTAEYHSQNDGNNK